MHLCIYIHIHIHIYIYIYISISIYIYISYLLVILTAPPCTCVHTEDSRAATSNAIGMDRIS
jgi:hypothetical protein